MILTERVKVWTMIMLVLNSCHKQNEGVLGENSKK